jgi:hypothetical protein
MTLIEVTWFLIHLGVFVSTTAVVGRDSGWIVGALSGVGATSLVVGTELLASFLAARRRGES